MDGLVLGDDGLWARPNQEYAQQKLEFFDRFGPAALKVTQRKFQRVYVDLFAGPGRNMADGVGFDSAAMRVLQMTAPGDTRLSFTHAHLVNKRPVEHGLLQQRIERVKARRGASIRHVECIPGDANVDGPAIVEKLQADFGRGAYVLVFADPESPSQLPWSTIDRIGQGAPESTDLYVLVPLDMAINRMVPNDADRIGPTADALTRYFGTDAWRPIYAGHPTSAQRPLLRDALLALYTRQLKRHWPFVQATRAVNRRGDQRLYRMLFCTRNPVAARLAHWEGSTYVTQGQLNLGLA